MAMELMATKEGTVPFNIPSVGTPCHTYYKVFGDLHCGSPPVVVIHGGPGAGHEYLLPFAKLWTLYGFPVVFYDQIGCASSTHLPDTAGNESLWQESLFIAELNNLLDALNLRSGSGYHVLGHSWGGMLAAAFASTRPPGLKRLVLASALASKELSIQGRLLRRQELPQSAQNAFDMAEQTGRYDTPEFKDAKIMFDKKYMCRVDDYPLEEMKPALKHTTEDSTVMTTL